LAIQTGRAETAVTPAIYGTGAAALLARRELSGCTVMASTLRIGTSHELALLPTAHTWAQLRLPDLVLAARANAVVQMERQAREYSRLSASPARGQVALGLLRVREPAGPLLVLLCDGGVELVVAHHQSECFEAGVGEHDPEALTATVLLMHPPEMSNVHSFFEVTVRQAPKLIGGESAQ
jgi:hypothetical protein